MADPVSPNHEDPENDSSEIHSGQNETDATSSSQDHDIDPGLDTPMLAEPAEIDPILTENELFFIDEPAPDEVDSESQKTVGPNEITIRSVEIVPKPVIVDAIVIDENTSISDLASNQTAASDSDLEEKHASAAPPVVEKKPPLSWQIKPESKLATESISSIGGAVASVILGVLALLGALVTSFSAINAVLGFFLGLWGLQSPRKRLAGAGIVLCIFGFIVPIAVGSVTLRDLWRSDNEVDPIEKAIMDETGDF